MIRRIEFGLDVEHVFGRKIVQYLCHKAEQQRQSALEAALALNPYTQAGEIMDHQVTVRAMDLWQQWLAEAVMEGQAAQNQLIESQQLG